MAAGYLIQANAWGGAWGYSWWGAWGNAWGQWTAEIDDVLVYHGGGKASDAGRRYGGYDATEELVRQQWDLLEMRLRSQREHEKTPEPQKHEALSVDESGPPVADVTLPMPVLAVEAIHPADATTNDEEDSSVAAVIEARKRRNQAAILLILSQV